MNFYEKKVLNLIDQDDQHFTSPEFCGLWGDNYDFGKILMVCHSLTSKGILKKRNCVGLAYERA